MILILVVLISPMFIYVEADATKIKMTSQNHNPILFLHGFTRASSDWITMIERFQADGWPNSTLFAYNFDENWNISDQASINKATTIKQWVDEIINETGEKIDLVGHSLGGVISRYYIKFLGGLERVDDYVSLGSPHHGTNSALQPPNAFLATLNEGDETPGGVLNDTLGDRVAPFSGVMYNGTHIPGNISYTSIYSRYDDIVPMNSSQLDGAVNIEIGGEFQSLWHLFFLTDEAVYEQVKAAVDDTLPHGTTETTSSTTETASGLEILPFLVIIILGAWYKRKKYYSL